MIYYAFPILFTGKTHRYRALKAGTKALLLCLLMSFLLCRTTAHAFTYMDGENGTDGKMADPCPAPIPCSKAKNHIEDQDNAYHNTLQSLHGTKDNIPNIVQVTPETDTAPATYTTTTPPQYIPPTGGYQYNGNGVGYPYTATR